MERINLQEKLALVQAPWTPAIIAEVNDIHVKVARLRGEFVWHAHAAEDELFLVLAGTLHMEFRDRTVVLGPGECLVVPRGVEHRPVAPEEVHVLLVEPAATLNTGSAERGPLTVDRLERI